MPRMLFLAMSVTDLLYYLLVSSAYMPSGLIIMLCCATVRMEMLVILSSLQLIVLSFNMIGYQKLLCA